MHKTMLAAGTALAVLAMTAAGAVAQVDSARGGRGGGGGAAPAPAAPPAAIAPRGGGGMMGRGGVDIGRGGPIASGPRFGGGPVVNPGWSGPRAGWYGRRHVYRPYPSFGSGFWFGSTYAGSPYYYDDYDDPYVYEDVPYVAGGTASPDDIAYCRQRFKSYDVRSGTYLGFDGQRHPCP